MQARGVFVRRQRGCQLSVAWSHDRHGSVVVVGFRVLDGKNRRLVCWLDSRWPETRPQTRSQSRHKHTIVQNMHKGGSRHEV